MQINVKMLESTLGVKTRKARNLLMFNVKSLNSADLFLLVDLAPGYDILVKRSGTGLVVILTPKQ